jgi:hypothetical protein
MIISLRDGVEIRLPVAPRDIEFITFDPVPAPNHEMEAGASRSNLTLSLRPSDHAGPADTETSGNDIGKVPFQGKIIRVGPGKQYRMPSDAARVARDGDVVEIDAGEYRADAAVWRQDNLTLRGIGGRAHLRADGAHAEGKAIWVLKGNNITVQSIEFSHARVPDRNGAGIRFEGTGLTIRDSSFHDNETGILTGRNDASDIVIERSEFARNTVPGYEEHGRLGHNIYIGQVRSFTLRYSYVHHAYTGHNVKSRARYNFILYNRMTDEAWGSSSYIVDLPIGGTAYLIGNVMHQGARAENLTMVSFAAEGAKDSAQALYVVNNSLVNDLGWGLFVDNRSVAEAQVFNNIFVGRGKVLNGLGRVEGNYVGSDPGFVDRANYDYRLTENSPAIDTGIALAAEVDGSLIPVAQYGHPLEVEPRISYGSIDIGAYEFVPH